MFYDAITFKANNGLLESWTNGTVIIHIKPVNDIPFFNRTSLNLTVLEDSPVIFKFDIKDVDAVDVLTVKITAIRMHGSIFLVDPAKEKSQGAPLGEGSELPFPYQLLYQPQADFFTTGLTTTQHFNISYSDGRITIVEEIAFTVLPINDPPRVFCSPTIDLPLSFITGASNIHQIRIIATDPESDNITYHLVQVPEKGVLYGISENGATMQLVNGSKFYSPIIQYSANSGGGYPFWNFAYVVEDSSQAKSEMCVSTFVFACPTGKASSYLERKI
ncbi:hypothetical protein BKA69DRAFT_1088216 [Paraphysoderma sedebokerense]|nr:hypothetical protein BKA69DRAFT_1088216 [Paraphysoderma sedebokerense]